MLLIALGLNVPLWLVVGVAVGDAPALVGVGVLFAFLMWIAGLGWIWFGNRSVRRHS